MLTTEQSERLEASAHGMTLERKDTREALTLSFAKKK